MPLHHHLPDDVIEELQLRVGATILQTCKDHGVTADGVSIPYVFLRDAARRSTLAVLDSLEPTFAKLPKEVP